MKKLAKSNRPQQAWRIQTNTLWRTTLLIALCFSFQSSREAQARNSFGVGYYAGPISGPTLSYSLSTKNTVKLITPLTFNNVVADYQYKIKSFSKGKFRFNVYFGIGTDVTLSESGNANGKKKKDEDKDGNNDPKVNDKASSGRFATAIRIPVGVTVKMARYPIDIFAEVAPQIELYDGSEFGISQSKIDLKRIGFGARYYF